MMINLKSNVKVNSIKEGKEFITDAYRITTYNNMISFYLDGIKVNSYNLNDIELIAEDNIIIIR